MGGGWGGGARAYRFAIRRDKLRAPRRRSEASGRPASQSRVTDSTLETISRLPAFSHLSHQPPNDHSLLVGCLPAVPTSAHHVPPTASTPSPSRPICQASDLLVGRPTGRGKPDQADPLESTEPSSASSAAVWGAGVDRARSGRRLPHARGEPDSREVQRQIPLHTRRANCGGPVEVVSVAPCPQPTQTGGGNDAIRSALSTGRMRPSSCARSRPPIP